MRGLPRVGVAIIGAIVPAMLTAAVVSAVSDADFGLGLAVVCGTPWAVLIGWAAGYVANEADECAEDGEPPAAPVSDETGEEPADPASDAETAPPTAPAASVPDPTGIDADAALFDDLVAEADADLQEKEE